MNQNINFLHINASDIRWGASITAYRFHKALRELGHGSHILCGLKELPGEDSSAIIPGKYGYVPNAAIGKAFNYAGLQSFGYPASLFLKSSKSVNDWADVAILRNLHWWYFSIGILPWMSKKVPLIWRLTDMWAFTGHCAYSYDCGRWMQGCGKCPRLGDYPELKFDTTHLLWNRKKKIYGSLRDRLVFVSPSRWLKDMVERSPMTKDFRCEYIPTAVDLSIFSPGLKEESRKILGIGRNEKVIMFSSFKLSDQRKGIGSILEVLNQLRKEQDLKITVLLIGDRGEELSFPEGIKAVKLGFISEDKFITTCYRAADVYLSMSKADNLPNTLIEAIACGLPVVALDNGGCREAFINGGSGYLIKNNKEAVDALKTILSDQGKQRFFASNARKFAETNFSMRRQTQGYIDLAKDMIKSHRRLKEKEVKDFEEDQKRRYVSGMRIDAVTYDKATERIIDLAKHKESKYICIANGHVLCEAHKDFDLCEGINKADIVTPDGASLALALKLLGIKKVQKVSGPELMPRVCEAAQEAGIPIGLYGGTQETLDNLIEKLGEKYPSLEVAYFYSPPFRELSEKEKQEVIEGINSSRARIIFVGLGCPKQERWCVERIGKVQAVTISVGAAFDFMAGSIKRAPVWMQKCGLEWVFRLIQEPKRLWKRYLIGNTVFACIMIKEIIKRYILKVK